MDQAAVIELTTAARSSYPTIVAGLAVALARAAAAGRWPKTQDSPRPLAPGGKITPWNE